ncbi:MAG TPA: hypothetical protein VLK82_10200 [Candidatus Tectomicrobia bacterium]|nr:hypothetical protein [Candidatus Tectomicrobia bacterium]
MIIRGTPHGYVDDIFQLLVVRDANDALLRFSRNSFEGPGLFRGDNVSAAVGGQLIRSDPRVYVLGGITHIVARGPNDELLEFWHPGDHWRLVNLSTAVAGGRLITGTPHGYTLNETQHIVARTPGGELLEWWWNPRHGWEAVVNLSAAVGGQLIRSDPWGYTLDETQHIVARGPNDELLEWYWTRQDGWGVLNVSAAVDGQLIRGTPYGFCWLLPPDDVLFPDHNALIDSQHIVARGRHDELLEWYWLPAPSWRRNHRFASLGGEWLEAVLNVMMR